VVRVALEVQWQRETAQQVLFKQPWLLVFYPTDLGVLLEPAVQPLFTEVGQGHARAATDTAQREVAPLGQKDTQGKPERRALSITAIVVPDTLAEILATTAVLR